MRVAVIIYVDENGRLLEMEFIRWDGLDLVDLQWGSFVVYP